MDITENAPRPTEKRRRAGLAVVVLIGLLFLGGQALYDQGVEAGREKEKQSMRLACSLARAGAETPVELVESAGICIDMIYDED